MENPQEWTLVLHVQQRELAYALMHDTLSPVVGSMPVDDSLPRLRAVEDAVYDTPLVLDDYRQVTVVVDAPHFALTPPQLPSPVREKILRASFSSVTGEVAECDTASGPGVVFELPRGLHSFFDRTFNMPPVLHHLAPLIDYVHDHSQVNVLVHCHGRDMIDVVVEYDGTLRLANCYECAGDNDALFYVLQACKAVGVDALHHELVLAGDEPACERLEPLLRDYFKHVAVEAPGEVPFILNQVKA